MDDKNSNKLEDKVKMIWARNGCVVNLAFRNLWNQIVVPKARKTREPARTFQPNSDLVKPATTRGDFVLNTLEVEKLGLINKSVHYFLICSKVLECSKQPIPN